MGNIMFGWQNRMMAGTLVAGSATTGLEVDNLANDQGSPATAWQTAGGVVGSAAGAWFTADAGAVVTWRAFLLARTNLSTAATVRWRVGAVESFYEAAPVIDLDFINGTPDVSAFTATRGGAGTGEATYFDASGNLVVAGGSEWRIGYDPATGTKLGLIWEPGRTNGIRNPRAQGAAADSPGTLPTNWAAVAAGGLSYAVAAVGIENGLPYVDLHVTGTAAGGGASYLALYPEGSTQIAAAVGQYWSTSAFAKLASAPTNGPSSAAAFLVEITSGGGGNGQAQKSLSLPNAAAALSAQRVEATFLTAASGGGTTAFVRPVWTYYFSAGATDATIRFAVPQCEAGECVTSPILPPVGAPAARARASDGASASVPASTSYAISVEATPYRVSANLTTTRDFGDVRLFSSSVSAAFITYLSRNASGVISATGYAWNPSASFGGIGGRVVTLGTKYRFAVSQAPGDPVAYTNGVANGFYSGVGDTGALDRFIIASSAYGVIVHGRIRVYGKRLTNGQVVALTSTSSTIDAAAVTFDSGTVPAGVAVGFRQSLVVAPVDVSGRMVRCDIDDPTNPDSCINVPLAYAGPVWQAAKNFGFSTVLAPQAAVDVVTSRGGQEFITSKYWRRSLQLAMPLVGYAELWPNLDAFLRAATTGANVLVVPNPDGADRARETIFGRVADPGSIAYANGWGRWRRWSGVVSERL